MRWRPKISLLTMLLATLLAGSGGLLCVHWEPWHSGLYIPHARKAALSADCTRIFTPRKEDANGGKFGYTSLALMDSARGEVLAETKYLILDPKLSILAPDGSRAAVLDSRPRTDNSSAKLVIWDLKHDSAPRVIGYHFDSDRPQWLAFSADGRMLFTQDLDFFDTKTGKLLFSLGIKGNARDEEDKTKSAVLAREAACAAKTLREFAELTRSLKLIPVVDPSGRRLVTLFPSSDTAQVWDLSTETKLDQMIDPVSDVARMHFFPNGEHLLRCYMEQTQVISVSDGKVSSTLPGLRFPDLNLEFHFDVNGRHVVLNGDRWSTHVLATLPLRHIHELPLGANDPDSLRLAPDGARVVLRKMVNKEPFQFLDVITGTPIATVPEIDTKWFRVLHFSPDGNRLFWEDDRGLHTLDRRRPEWLWGVLFLPEFWLVAVLFAAVIWSMIRDRRYFNLSRLSNAAEVRSATALVS